MAILAATTLTLLVFPQPQGDDDARLKPTLRDSELSTLNRQAQKWMEAEADWDKKDSASIRRRFLREEEQEAGPADQRR